MGMKGKFVPQFPGKRAIFYKYESWLPYFNEVKEWGEYGTRNADDKIVKAR